MVDTLASDKGVRLHYLDSDPDNCEPPAAPIVFIPGLSDVADDYTAMAAVLGRRTIVIDLRGRGKSDTPAENYCLDDHVGDIEAVVAAVTDGPIHVMAFSRGSCYGLAWASRNAGRVRSISIGDYPAREIAVPPDVADTFAAGRWRGTPMAGRIGRHAVRRVFADAVDRPMWDELVSLDRPTLIVRSGTGGPITDDDWARYADEVPEATRVTFEDSPHDIFRPDRSRYPELVRAHVAQADADSRVDG